MLRQNIKKYLDKEFKELAEEGKRGGPMKTTGISKKGSVSSPNIGMEKYRRTNMLNEEETNDR